MQSQLAEMHSQTITTRAQIRANVARGDIQIEPWMENGVLAGWMINPMWTNVGSTDATDVRNWYNIKFVAGAPERIWTPKDCPSPDQPKEIFPNVLQPQRGFAEIGQLMSILDVRKASNRGGMIFIVGHIEYRDIFFPDSQKHHFDWCVFVIPNDFTNNLFSFVNGRQDAN
jgi:hypothetical protein